MHCTPLHMNEPFEIIVAFTYEEMKEADAESYCQTNFLVEPVRFLDEMHKKNYMIMICNMSNKSDRYLNLHL